MLLALTRRTREEDAQAALGVRAARRALLRAVTRAEALPPGEPAGPWPFNRVFVSTKGVQRALLSALGKGLSVAPSCPFPSFVSGRSGAGCSVASRSHMAAPSLDTG